MTNSTKSLAEEIADQIQEVEFLPRRKVAQIVEICGEDFASQILAQTLKIQENGGMLTAVGDRQRTIGGVFFHLARYQMTPDVRKQIFPLPWEKKKETAVYQRKQAALAAAMPPDVFQRYEELKASIAELQRKLNPAAQGYTGEMEGERQKLVELQREIYAIEKEYKSILHLNSGGKPKR